MIKAGLRAKVSHRAFRLFACSLLLFPAVPGTCHAYLDPGGGSLFLQLVLATAAGALVTLRIYWKKLVETFNRLIRRSGPPAPPDRSK
jgi:hypothetical protein